MATNLIGLVIYISFDVSKNIAQGILVFHVMDELASPSIGWNTMMTASAGAKTSLSFNRMQRIAFKYRISTEQMTEFTHYNGLTNFMGR